MPVTLDALAHDALAHDALAHDALAHDALELSPDQRVALAYRLLVSVDPEPGADAAWDGTIAERIARYDAGDSPAVPAAEAFERLQKIAPGE